MKQLIDYGIDHVGFIVPSVDDAVAHMREHYGVKDVTILSPYLETCWTRGKPHPQQCKCAIVFFGDNQCKFEFLEPVTEGGYHWDWLHGGNFGLNHVCFKVKDFDHWLEHFKKLGHDLFFQYEAEDEPNGYRRCLYSRDPFLNLVCEVKEINRYRDADGVLEP